MDCATTSTPSARRTVTVASLRPTTTPSRLLFSPTKPATKALAGLS